MWREKKAFEETCMPPTVFSVDMVNDWFGEGAVIPI